MKPVSRIAVLWEHITGYVQAALNGLIISPEVSLFVVERIQQANAAFQMDSTERTTVIHRHSRPTTDTSWLDDLLAFAPEVALITGGGEPGYHRAAHLLHKSGTITVWASDRILRSWWRDAFQAYQGRLRRRWRHYDLAFVPGAAGNRYAQNIGFPSARIVQGLYTCETAIFRPVGVARHQPAAASSWPPVFLYLGQLIPRKGIDLLLTAYRNYRAQARNPWALWCIGSGPLADQIVGSPGVRLFPFLGPQECAEIMGNVGALILPSIWDHWGVVIHEATCAGLPIIASLGCGAVHDLVIPDCNGYTFPVGDVIGLTQDMLRLSGEGRAREMGIESLRLSNRFDPSRFAQIVREQIPARVVA